jgi:hypothetical protein
VSARPRNAHGPLSWGTLTRVTLASCRGEVGEGGYTPPPLLPPPPPHRPSRPLTSFKSSPTLSPHCTPHLGLVPHPAFSRPPHRQCLPPTPPDPRPCSPPRAEHRRRRRRLIGRRARQVHRLR